MAQGGNEQLNRGDWETGARALASSVASRYLNLAEWVTGHATPPVRTASVGASRGAPTLASQISQKASWSNAVADRVGGLSYSISRVRQSTDLPVEPSSMVWFNRQRESRSRFAQDEAIPYPDFQDTAPSFDKTAASSSATSQREATGPVPAPSSSVREAHDAREAGTTPPVRRAVADRQQSSYPKAAQFAAAHRARIQRLPATAASGPLLQGKGILSSRYVTTDESVPVPPSESRLPHRPSMTIRAVDSGHRASAMEGEIAETGRPSGGEGHSPLLQRHRETDVPLSPPLGTGSETDARQPAGRRQPSYEQFTPLTQKTPSIALSSSSMGLFSRESTASGIPPIPPGKPLSSLRRSPAVDDEQGETPEARVVPLPSATPEGPPTSRALPSTAFSPKPMTLGQPPSAAPTVQRRRTGPAEREGEHPGSVQSQIEALPDSGLVLPRTTPAPRREGLPETIAAKYEPERTAVRPMMAGPLSLIRPSAARSEERPARTAEDATVSPTGEGILHTQPEEELATALTGKYEPDRGVPFSETGKPLSLIQRAPVKGPSDSSPRISSKTMRQGLSEEVAEKYLPEETITRSLATERLSTVEPFIAAKSHEAPATGGPAPEEEKVFDYFPQERGMPGQVRAGESGIPGPSMVPSSSEARTIHREVYRGEAPHEEADVWSLPDLVPPRTATPEGILRAYEPVEPILARFADRPTRETVDHEMAMAPIQRVAGEESAPVMSRAEEGEEEETEDVEELAREVYAIIKRRLNVERERLGCR